jgi:hypothetical protein
VVPYNCTNVVPVLPARMAIHSDSCTLWKKSGHIEDELKNHLLGRFRHQFSYIVLPDLIQRLLGIDFALFKTTVFGLNCLSMTPTDVDFITAGGEPAFRTSERYYDWGVKVEIMDCNGKPMAIVKENLLHSFAHTPRAEYVVELPGEEIFACLSIP